MPVYIYKAVTKTGLVVKNKVESSSKQTLLKMLKANNLLPIDVMQVAYAGKSLTKKKPKKKNIEDISEIVKNINTTNLERTKSKQLSVYEKVNLYLEGTKKVT